MQKNRFKKIRFFKGDSTHSYAQVSPLEGTLYVIRKLTLNKKAKIVLDGDEYDEDFEDE